MAQQGTENRPALPAGPRSNGRLLRPHQGCSPGRVSAQVGGEEVGFFGARRASKVWEPDAQARVSERVRRMTRFLVILPLLVAAPPTRADEPAWQAVLGDLPKREKAG